MNKRKLLIIITILILIFLIFILKNKEKKYNIKDKITNKCKTINYCNNRNINRYIKYYKRNKNLEIEDVITYVNLGLDYKYYTHVKKSPYLNKDYILVNKYLYLDKNYIPNNLISIPLEYSKSGMMLVKSAQKNFINMAKDAYKSGNKIIVMSSYRSYEYQENLYNKYKEKDGITLADTYSARAGFSEHQTGLSIDIYDGIIDYNSFEKSKSFKWMQKNSYKYGFILRFPKNKEKITGYNYESWHYRYVGKKIAKYIHNNNITFDEYYAKFIQQR